MKRSTKPLLSLLCVSVLALAATSRPAAQEVVQPLPPREVDQLNAALQLLARNGRDVDALVAAGDASLALDDIEAAIGFYVRAEELSPRNPRVMLGLATASVRARDPLRAIGLFDAAEQAGADIASAAADRGLAYDLVGDNLSAQAQYRKALDRGDDAEVRRRLALSLAISGDREGFDRTLNPLVAKGDAASYRTRAFGLAILGEEDEAVAIAGAVMPSAMSARMEPYLRYMKRLTQAQQAAAANLGTFPRASQIGRDSQEVALYREQNGLLRTADARLAPQGEPLGRRADASSPRRRPDRGSSVAAGPATDTGGAVVQAMPQSRAPDMPTGVAVRELPVEGPNEANVAASGEAMPQPGFDLADLPGEAQTATSDETASVAEAFASFTTAAPQPAPTASGVVDITRIEPPREIERPAPPPPKVEHPSRHWVQVATGRDVKALGFDWRRFSRAVPEILGKVEPHVTPWGEANRLLAGPYRSAEEARKAMNSLKELGVDSFTYQSPEGQAIDPLG